MGAEWRTLTLGDVIRPMREPLTILDERCYEQVTVAIKGRGLRSRGVIKGSEVKTKRQFRIRAGQLLVSKIDARNGALGVVPAELDEAIVTSDFPAFEIDDEQCLPAYLDLFVRRPLFWEECLTVSEGSTNRVRLVPDQFLELPLDLPSMEQQRMIAAAVAMADDLAHSFEQETRASAQLLDALREELFAEWPVVEIGSLLVGIQGGRSPRALEREPAADESGVLKVSAIRSGEFRANEVKALIDDKMMPEHAVVQLGDLLINRASGSPALLCSACLVDYEVKGLYLSDKTLRLLPGPDVDSTCLMEAFALRATREQIEFEGHGTSGAKNISQEGIRAIEIPWPGASADQARIAKITAAVRSVVRWGRRSASAALMARDVLVDTLITNAPRIPSAEHR